MYRAVPNDRPKGINQMGIAVERMSQDTMLALRNIHRGERCFIVGNGPSLNKLELRKLDEEYSFSVNSIHYKVRENAFRPCYYVVEDRFVLIENIEEIRRLGARLKFFPKSYRSLIGDCENVVYFDLNLDFYKRESPYYHLPRFSHDCAERIFAGQTVTYVNMQLAVYMGFSEIYLIGMDFDYKLPEKHGSVIVSSGDDENHFHKDYFGKGKTWQDPQLDMVARSYRQFALSAEFAGAQVFNATAGGKLELFPRVDFNSLFYDQGDKPHG